MSLRIHSHLKFSFFLCLGLTAALANSVQAATSSDGVWADPDPNRAAKSKSSAEMRVKGVQNYRIVDLDWDKVNAILATTPIDQEIGAKILELPVPSGEFARFKVWETSLMAPDLAAKFPDIKTYTGQGVDDPTATVKISVTPEKGFQAMILSGLRGTIYLDPYTKGDRGQYIVYYRKDFKVDEEFRLKQKETHIRRQRHKEVLQRRTLKKISLGAELRTYRLALAATGEYTLFHATAAGLPATATDVQKKAAALAAMVVAINRVTGIYERDFSIKLQLVNNTAYIFTDPVADGLTNGDDAATQIKSILDTALTVTGYDIGHVFHTGGGGIATTSVVCFDTRKAEGATGLANPTGDPFYVDFVAHEMGHQFGADHTFNGILGECDNTQRSNVENYEPGSGTTIISYAGICGADNILSPNGDDYFHSSSIERVFEYTRNDDDGKSCGTQTANGNTIPAVDAGPEINPAFTIPKRTPFELTGTGSDANGDALTYTWEQFNGGQTPGLLPAELVAFNPNNAVTNEPTDNGPIFRSFKPRTSATRVFPRLSDLLKNEITKGEVLPSKTRDLTFRLTVRDNRAGGGGVNQDDLFMKVDANSGPFIVTAPNTALSWNTGTQQTVTWDVANTDQEPVSCESVNILLSTDGGNTFPTTLSANTANDGTETITVPAAATIQARVKVKCADNVFFDISNLNFTIMATAPTHTLPTNQWHQISLPMNPPSGNNTVAAIFGDDGLGTYGTNWVIFRYNTTSNSYVQPALTDTLSQGVGYWIIQNTGSNKTLDMPTGSTPTPTTGATGCPASQCFAIPLATKSGANQFNMIGYPFSTGAPFNNARIVATSTNCSAGCTISQANTDGIFQNQLWSYNGTGYDNIHTSSGNLDPWRGYWARTLNNADGNNPSLLVPQP